MSTASCPAALSLIFRVHPHVSPKLMGSTGVGCTIDRDVSAEVKPDNINSIRFNGQDVNLAPVAWIRGQLSLSPVSISLSSDLPLGCGFGLSGASTLAAAHALNTLFDLDKTVEQLALLAHVAEIVSKTGLGTVATQLHGGFLLKTTPGVHGNYSRLPHTGQHIWAVIIGSLQTPHMLRSSVERETVNNAADAVMKKIDNRTSLNRIFDLAYEFARNSGLLEERQVKPIIEKVRAAGGHATMAMLGEVVLTTTRPKLETGHKIIKLTIK